MRRRFVEMELTVAHGVESLVALENTNLFEDVSFDGTFHKCDITVTFSYETEKDYKFINELSFKLLNLDKSIKGVKIESITSYVD